MAFFGKKKEVKMDTSSLPEEFKPHLDLRPEYQTPDKNAPHAEESQFASPDDLMKIMNEQTEMPHSEAPARKPTQTSYPPLQYPQTQNPIMPAQTPQSFAPLFVKVEKYNNILKSLSELKTTMKVMKNSLSALSQLDQIRNENMNLILNALDKVEKKLLALDAAFLRPANLQEESSDNEEVEGLQSVMSDLQSQIAQLKNQVQMD